MASSELKLAIISIMNQFYFSCEEIFSHPELLLQNGITEFELSDEKFLSDKTWLLTFLIKLQNLKNCPNITFYVKPDVLDAKIVNLMCTIPCALQIDFLPDYLGDKKKFFSKKMALLNDSGLIFGFDIHVSQFPTIKQFKMSISESLSYYPNHLYFDTENLLPTEKLSTQDIKNIKRLSFALETFYSAGRAVSWFMSVIYSLRLRPDAFFSDFAEWQDCNNCSQNSDFNLNQVSYDEIQKMQLSFLKLKYEEKNLSYIYPIAHDLVCLHGAFSSCDLDGTSSTVELFYHPDDVLSPYAMDLRTFSDESYLEPCSVLVSSGKDGSELKIL